MTSYFNIDLAQNLRSLRDRLAQRLNQRSHGRIITDVDATGIHEAGCVITVQKPDSESLESFLVRVWMEYNQSHTSIEWSTHDGRLTAKISTRSPGADDDLRQEVIQLRCQVVVLTEYLAKLTPCC